MFSRVKHWIGASSKDVLQPQPRGTPTQVAASGQCLALYEQGVAHYRAGELALAERALNEALALKHDLAEAHFQLARIHRRRAQHEEAADCLLLATTFKPDFAEAWYQLGVIEQERGRLERAASAFEAALQHKPDYAEAWNGLGTLHEKRKQFRAAAVAFEKAIEIDPRLARAHSNLAHVTLRERFDADAALAHARKAIELDPQLAAAHNNLAMILQAQGRCDEALAACERALALDPGAASTVLVRSYARLMLGRFEDGWRDFEARKQLMQTFKVRKFPYPEWDGSPLAGKSVLVYYEQGVGDEIMFASCLPDLLALGGSCVVECSHKLERLFRRSFPRASIQAADQADPDMSYLGAWPRFDWQVAAGSLPRRFRNNWGEFPTHSGYLSADAARVAFWRMRLQDLGAGLKVGLSWRGGRPHTNQAQRSIELEKLIPLLATPGARFVSLQYTDCRDELDRLRARHGITLTHWQEAIDDYDETAALVGALDLVISVQTAVVHLAGALGRPAWVCVSSMPEWRYMADGERMPWYPSVRLFRQRVPRDWDTVIAQVATALREFIGARIV